MFFQKKKFKIKPFALVSDDPLQEEHKVIIKWSEEATKDDKAYYLLNENDIKKYPSGLKIWEANPEQSRRFVLAALQQIKHWDKEFQRVTEQGKTHFERINAHHLPGGQIVLSLRRTTALVMSALLRRSLPFNENDLIQILDWSCGLDERWTFQTPTGHIVRTLQRHLKQNDISPLLNDAIKQFGENLRSSLNKDTKRWGTAIEQMLHKDDIKEKYEPFPSIHDYRLVTPAPTGNNAILNQLKCYLGLLEKDDVTTEILDPDRFPLRKDSPLLTEHKILSELFQEVVSTRDYSYPIFKTLKIGNKILKMSPSDKGRMLLATAERVVNAILGGSYNIEENQVWQSRYAAIGTYTSLSMNEITLERDGLFDLLLFMASWRISRLDSNGYKTLFKWIQEAVASDVLTEGERYVLYIYRASIIEGPPLGAASEAEEHLSKLIGDGSNFYLVPGEYWSDAFNTDLGTMPQNDRRIWLELLHLLLTSTSAKPSQKWLKTAKPLMETIGITPIKTALIKYFHLMPKGRTFRKLGSHIHDTRSIGDIIHEENATCLRGMLWLAPLLEPDAELAQAVTAVALSAYRKIPGIGPRAVKVGNAAVYALSEMKSDTSVGQLAILQAKVKFGTAQKMIEKAFNAVAELAGLSRDEIDELSVPEYGLTDIGLRIEQIGDFQAKLAIIDLKTTELTWIKPDGKIQKGVPQAVKDNFADDLKELKAAMKDIQQMLPAQRERLDKLHLKQKKWPLSIWKERYLDHPLVGVLTRKLIWNFETNHNTAAAVWLDGAIVNNEGKTVEGLDDAAQVSLWHPIGKSPQDILRWREFLEKHQIKQSFKQAHREIYLLTDAEQETRVYSNRYASHIIKQHQFNALCGVRGWKNSLQLMVDQEFPPAHLVIPTYNIRAEFWASGAGDDYGVDTNETGTYYYLSTDQVRFYQIDQPLGAGAHFGQHYGNQQAQPMTLQDVPALVFSEVMRDVDMFVGVASVGNDPTWADGGPEGRYQAYWHSYSFGALSETAKTRKEVLEKLVPRLNISDRCRLEDKFLIVRGDIRTYKIHLGSGNILMEPNDQYLCIVPAQSAQNLGKEKVFLPFEGDNTLSVILSKAFLLADDRKIKDATIVNQIRR